MSSIVLVSGGFDPLHSGHIAFFKEAKTLGEEFDAKLCVAVNSDEWLTRKKGNYFMKVDERVTIIKELECVDVVIEFNDTDNSANDAIWMALEIYDRVIFANGGDRHNENTPEYEKYGKDERVIFRWGIGGTDKKNSSSWMLDRWNK